MDGNSKLEVSRSAASLAGPGIAGVLVAAITAPFAILVDAISFFVSGGFVAAIRRREPPPERAEERSMRKELMEGLRYLLGHRYWRPIAICVALSNGFGSVGGSIFLVYAVRELDMSAAVVGIVFGIGNVGWLLGAMVAGRLSGSLGVGKTIVGVDVPVRPGARCSFRWRRNPPRSRSSSPASSSSASPRSSST